MNEDRAKLYEATADAMMGIGRSAFYPHRCADAHAAG
jgi:hypothetical protein